MIADTPGAGRVRAGSHWQAIVAAVAVAGLTLVATGCSSGAAQPAATPPSSAGAPPAGAPPAGGGSGGQVSSRNRSGSQVNQTAGNFSLAFARCMRANGVPAFPNPNGHGGQLGPDSGIDPASPQFQSAINGPCRSTAPPNWLGSGKVSAPGSGNS